MTVNFWEQDGQPSAVEITNIHDLLLFFESFVEREPFYCEFLQEGAKLSVCIRGSLGSVQHSSATNDPPYRMAVTQAEYDPEAEVVFFIENEATPVLARYALPLDAVKRIIMYFWKSGEPDPYFSWNKI